MNSNKRTLIGAAAAAVLLVVGVTAGYLIANSTDDQASSGTTIASVSARASNTAHNNADVTFVQMMIPHHQQALEMAKMAKGRALSPAVHQLANAIQAAQQPEIERMQGWIKQWGVPMHSSMSMGSGMSGTMSNADMNKLMGLQGSAFDQEFLTMMTSHHDGAISMATDELKTGQNANALALATSIAVTQAAEVQHMSMLLNNN